MAARSQRPVPLAEVLVEGSTYSRSKLKDRLYGCGLKARRCELCGQGDCVRIFVPPWAGQRHCSIECGCRTVTVIAHPSRTGRKVPRPSYDQLMQDIRSMSFVAIGREYGVSDNAVRKWIRWYEYQREMERWRAQKARISDRHSSSSWERS